VLFSVVAGGAGNKKPTTVSSRGILSKFVLITTSTNGVACYYDDCQFYLPNVFEHWQKTKNPPPDCQAFVRPRYPKPACFQPLNQQIARAMGSPIQPVTLSAEQVTALSKKLSTLRHDINNNLTLIIAALELIRYKPDMAEKMIATMIEQPMKISTAMGKFSEDFEKALEIQR
jgi:hypothetical protein